MGRLFSVIRKRWRVAVAFPAIAVLAVGTMVIPASAEGRLPGITVKAITQWPVHAPHRAPLPAVTPSIGRVGTVSQYIFANVPLVQAQADAQFHIWVPVSVPAGYHLDYATVQRQRPTPTVDLTYQQDGQPNRPLDLVEHVVNVTVPENAYAVPGAVEQLSIAGQPALYFGAQAAQRPGSAEVLADAASNTLVLDRAGVQVTITGWRNAGIDRTALQQIAASLR